MDGSKHYSPSLMSITVYIQLNNDGGETGQLKMKRGSMAK